MKRVILAFVLGACSGTVASSVADDPAEPVEVDAAPEAVEVPQALAATVRSLEQAEHRQAPPATADIWLLAEGEQAFVGLLTMVGGAAVPEHQDATEEYIHVLEGSGVITIDGEEHALSPGSTVFMPAGATVSYANGEAPMKALQVFAGPAPAAKYDSWMLVQR